MCHGRAFREALLLVVGTALVVTFAPSLCAAPPSGFPITVVTAVPVGQYRKVEIRCDGITTSYTNPFDPGEVSVEGHFIDPDGGEDVVYGFWYRGYERSLVSGNEELTPVGEAAHWRVRYAPRKPGSYTCHVTVTDSGGTSQSASRSFTVTPSSTPKGTPLRQAALRISRRPARCLSRKSSVK